MTQNWKKIQAFYDFHSNNSGTVWATEMVRYSKELSQYQQQFFFGGDLLSVEWLAGKTQYFFLSKIAFFVKTVTSAKNYGMDILAAITREPFDP